MKMGRTACHAFLHVLIFLAFVSDYAKGQKIHGYYDMGKTNWGDVSEKVLCPRGETVIGFRLRIHRLGWIFQDSSGLNGIQLKCSSGQVTSKITAPDGDWRKFVTCKRNAYVTGFNFRSQREQFFFGDNLAGVDVKMQCSDRKQVLDGDGLQRGSWEVRGFQECPAKSYFCGVQARIEHWHKYDSTGINRIRFYCCSVENGTWGAWSPWTKCSKSCGMGTRYKTRRCDNPKPMPGGLNCLTKNGKRDQQERVQDSCYAGSCPGIVDGGWGQWGTWSTCSVTCGPGQRTRSRLCDNPSPGNDGLQCKTKLGQRNSTESEIGKCMEKPCKIDGNWGPWSPLSACSKTCSKGVRSMFRYCDSPLPSAGGLKCRTTNGTERMHETLQFECNERNCSGIFNHLAGEWLVYYTDGIINADTYTITTNGTITSNGNAKSVFIEGSHDQFNYPLSHGWFQFRSLWSSELREEYIRLREDGTLEIHHFCAGHFCIGGNHCCTAIGRNNIFVGRFKRKNFTKGNDTGLDDWEHITIQYQRYQGNYMMQNRLGKHCNLFSSTKDSLRVEKDFPLNKEGNHTIKFTEVGAYGPDNFIFRRTAWRKCEEEAMNHDNMPYTIADLHALHCDAEGFYDTTQCDLMLGNCWCVDKYTGKQQTGTMAHPGEAALINCVVNEHKTLVGKWEITGDHFNDVYTINENGKITSNSSGRSSELGGSNYEELFPSSKGWYLVSMLHNETSWEFHQITNNGTLIMICPRDCEDVRLKKKKCCQNVRGERAVNGDWGGWGNWSSCSVSCSNGTRTRRRYCNNPVPKAGGSECKIGNNSRGLVETQMKNCTSKPCPVHGNWSNWTEWSSCSASCSNGTQTRTRQCSSPSPEEGGSECKRGNDTRGLIETQMKNCTSKPCPVHGNWSQWTKWSSCSASCSNGTETRTRQCSSPSPEEGGSECKRSNDTRGLIETEVKNCSSKACPVDGDWTQWSQWSSCSTSCSNGTRTRIRQCENPLPQSGGLKCLSDGTRKHIEQASETCLQRKCAEIFSELVGEWWVSFLTNYADTYTITGSGIIQSKTSRNNSTLELSDNNVDFPASQGWFKYTSMRSGWYADSGTDYIRARPDGTLEVHHFCKDQFHCGLKYNHTEHYCCKGKGRRTLFFGRFQGNLAQRKVIMTVQYQRDRKMYLMKYSDGVVWEMVSANKNALKVVGCNNIPCSNKGSLVYFSTSGVNLSSTDFCKRIRLRECEKKSMERYYGPPGLRTNAKVCDDQGFYAEKQCFSALSSCQCVDKYTGNEIPNTGTSGKQNPINCVITAYPILIGKWKLSGIDFEDIYTITKDGKIKSAESPERIVELETSDNEESFPSSEGWYMVKKLHSETSLEYQKVNKDDSLSVCPVDCSIEERKQKCCRNIVGRMEMTVPTMSRQKGGHKKHPSIVVPLRIIGQDITHYDVIVAELGQKSTFPRSDPQSYTNNDIKDNVDGLYVAGRISDKTQFGTTFVVGKQDDTDTRRRKRRSLAQPDNKQLKEGTYYGVFIRGYVTDDEYTSSPWYPPVKTVVINNDEATTSSTAAAIVVVVLVVVGAILLYFLYRWWKQRMDKAIQNNMRQITNDGHFASATNPSFVIDDNESWEPGINVDNEYETLPRDMSSRYEVEFEQLPTIDQLRGPVPASHQEDVYATIPSRQSSLRHIQATQTEPQIKSLGNERSKDGVRWTKEGVIECEIIPRARPRPSNKTNRATEESDIENTPNSSNSIEQPTYQEINPNGEQDSRDPLSPHVGYEDIVTSPNEYMSLPNVYSVPSTIPRNPFSTTADPPTNYFNSDIQQQTRTESFSSPHPTASGYAELDINATPQSINTQQPGYNVLMMSGTFQPEVSTNSEIHDEGLYSTPVLTSPSEATQSKEEEDHYVMMK